MTAFLRVRRLVAGAAATGLLAGGAVLGMSGAATADPAPPPSPSSVVTSDHDGNCHWVKGHWEKTWVKGHWEKKRVDHKTWHHGHWEHHITYKWVHVPGHWEHQWVKGHWECHHH
ncbi:hypothetical protein ACFWBB_30570 [Streptomyces sp. NPDC060000]|uniref:hypothetical protein n=1 Tax=Streptomyces sp. NPDC060000 TaxID=3347031 RepID=UPI0036CA453D